MLRRIIFFLAFVSCSFAQDITWDAPSSWEQGEDYYVEATADSSFVSPYMELYKDSYYFTSDYYSTGAYTNDWDMHTVWFDAEGYDDYTSYSFSDWHSVVITQGMHDPTVSIGYPSSVPINSQVIISIDVGDVDGDLLSMGIRWQGSGLVGGPWNISGSSASDSTTVPAPSTAGTMYVRGEVWDNNNHGIISNGGNWEEIEVYVPTHTLTVNSGSGGGTFEEGTSHSISADSPASGYEFSYWSVSGSGSIDNAYAADTSFTIGSGDATVTAQYEDIPDAPAATISPASSTLDVDVEGNWDIGATDADDNLRRWRVSLLPNTAGWTNISGNQSSGFSYTFNSGGDYTFRLEVEDWTGLTDSSDANVHVRGHQSTVSISPSSQSITVGGNITFDASGGSGTGAYVWGDDASGTGSTKDVTFNTTGNRTVTVYRAGDSNYVDSDTATATITVNDAPAAPSITTQPQSQTVNAGAGATVSVTATGTPAPSYQWRKNGGDIAGATNASYSIASVQSSDAGSYTVYVSNTAGNVTSDTATLTVNTAPVITTQPQNQTVAAGGTANFSVVASGTPTPTYQWRKNGTNLSNGGNVAGATSVTLTLTNVQTVDAATYSVVATNSAGGATSNGATLTITAITPIDLELHRP